MRANGAIWREAIAEDGLLVAPGVHDPLDALIVERVGFKAVYLGGNAMALGIGKGQPYLTLTETTQIVSRVASAVNIPVLVDAGAGFGTCSHIDFAVRELEHAGAAALHIDDQPYPKHPDYHRGRGALTDVADMCNRLKTACGARDDESLSIVARTDALRVTKSLDETIERARAYCNTGIDGLIVLDLSPADLPRVQQAVPDLPIYWIGGVQAPVPNSSTLAEAGFAAALYPFSGIAEVVVRLKDLWETLLNTGQIEQDESLLTSARLITAEVAALERAWNIEDRMLGKGHGS